MQGNGSRRARWGGPANHRALLIAVGVLAFVASGCSSKQKKLSSGGGITDVLVYDILGQSRTPDYYYRIVNESHDKERFCYRCTDDVYLVDKNIDAVQKLGDAQFSRLGGQAQVVNKLTEVLLEDPSPLAQANAANSLTKIALKTPTYPGARVEERGDVFLASLQEMDAMFDENGRRIGRSKQRQIQILTQMGNFDIEDLVIAKQSVRPFFTRPYLIDESDPEIRAAIDTANVKRTRQLVIVALKGAVQSKAAWVREESIRGLKTLNERSAEELVIAQMQYESDWRVRAESVEYLGKMGDATAVGELLPLLEDPDPTIRHKARQALARVAGRDLGIRRRTWTRWAQSRFPDVKIEDEDGQSEAVAANDPR